MAGLFPVLNVRLVQAARWLGRLLYRGLLLYCWLLLVLYLGFKVAERQSAIAALPTNIEPAGVVLIGGESGLREGCGVAVWRMSTAMRQRLASHGLAALTQARQARGHADEPYYRYAPWQPTPVGEGISPVELGLQCADSDQALTRRIHQAMHSPGAFYSHKDEGLLLVIPAEGLIVFGYFG
ncbi:hypothetical protein LRS11_07020 [Pseudomonas sp. J452]|uniref:hypothetical protein n=1 Tax=Pseudomonas sp. J452 TaxID=2898441 RepID=UPI0021ADFE0D|nr:hypothetical protein [Pseudomonas sp. J452]UUY09778.1 hypothetical protein LRS11_07020 [Pseudomonas sp. J452]